MTEGPRSTRLDRIVAATPASRDRVVDFLRAASIVAVVFGHWFIGIVWWQNGVLRTTSAVGVTTGLWLATWFFQVMPVFFFVGGFSNLVSLDASRRRGDPDTRFVRTRVMRLLRPSLVFFVVWSVVIVAMHLLDVGAPTGPRIWPETRLLRLFLPPGATLPFGPLWFLAVYLVVVCIAPWMVDLHRRFRWRVPAAMAIGAVLADVIGFQVGISWVRWANVAFVLLFPHQLGFFYADGTFSRLSKRVFWAMVAIGLGGLVLLTNPPFWELFGNVRFDWFPGIGAYPKSLLGTDVELVSNAYPPTVCFLLGGVWSIGAIMLLRPFLARWLGDPGPWRATIFLNGVIMTLFLWHMTAYLFTVLTLWPLGFGQQHDSTAGWWLERPLWIGLSAVYLAGLVAIFGRFEQPREPAPTAS
jgi:fucose 4-O-acetylase-like acetyltransferase